MRVAERGAKRTGQGVLWVVLVLLMLAGLWISASLGAVALVGLSLFGVLAIMCGIKAYAAFTGVKRFGQPS